MKEKQENHTQPCQCNLCKLAHTIDRVFPKPIPPDQRKLLNELWARMEASLLDKDMAETKIQAALACLNDFSLSCEVLTLVKERQDER